MTPEAKSRLNEVTAELRRRGVVDVKLTLSPEAAGLPADQVAQDVLAFFSAYLRGSPRPLEAFDAELPSVPDEFELKDLAASEFEVAMSSGVSRDNFERLAMAVALKVSKAHVLQNQAVLPLLERVLHATVTPSQPLVTPEVIKALLHARHHAQQPGDDPSDLVLLAKAGRELLRAVNDAWRSLGLKPSISEQDALDYIAGQSEEKTTKT